MFLLAEPDATVAADLLDRARSVGIRAEWCRDGGEALVQAGATQPDLVVAAAELPVLATRAVIETIRNRWRMRILVGAGSGQEHLGAMALEAGAAAVVARPYDLDTVLTLGFGTFSWVPARGIGATVGVLVAGPITIDTERHEVSMDGRELRFTHRELQLLTYLITRGGRVASRDEISAAVWGHVVDTNTVAVHIKRLRDKLGDHPAHGQLIRTVRGAGYRIASTLCDGVG
jgi:DNA-binding response OmpR family regulator